MGNLNLSAIVVPCFSWLLCSPPMPLPRTGLVNSTTAATVLGPLFSLMFACFPSTQLAKWPISAPSLIPTLPCMKGTAAVSHRFLQDMLCAASLSAMTALVHLSSALPSPTKCASNGPLLELLLNSWIALLHLHQ